MKPKNIVISGLILASLLTPSLGVLAQTASTTTVNLTPEAHALLVADIQKQINDLMVQILLAQIAELKAQIADLIAQQSQTQTQLGAVQTQVDTVVTQTAPVATPVVQAPQPSISMDFSCENGMVKIATNVLNAPMGYYHVSGERVNGGFMWSTSAEPNPYISFRPPVLLTWEAKALADNAGQYLGDGKYGYDTSWLAKEAGTFDGTVCANR